MAKNAKIFFTIRIYLSLQNPKNAKDGAESMFGPSWIHEKGEKTDGPVYEEIFCKSKSFATLAEDINICIF